MRVTDIPDIIVEDRMKAIVKCHATLPIDLLFCPCDRIFDANSVNRWAPVSPQVQRLDDRFGTMKLFTDYLYISQRTSSRNLQMYFVSLEGGLDKRFLLDIPKARPLWVEMHLTESAPPATNPGGNIICLMFPTEPGASFQHPTSAGRGARFIIQKREENDIYLMYDGSFRTYIYDRSDIQLPAKISLRPISRIEPTPRVFVSCGKSCHSQILIILLDLMMIYLDITNWPTATLLYDTVEGPIASRPATHILFMSYIMLHIAGMILSIITIAVAAHFHLKRLPIFYCHLGKFSFAAFEIFWYAAIFKRIEKDAWSMNAARNRATFSCYDAINRHPSLFFGSKRAVLLFSITIALLCIGIVYQDQSWALWCGVLLGLEMVMRSILYCCWFTLPKIPLVRSKIDQAVTAFFPKWIARTMRARESLLTTHERVPFHQEAAEPFQETWSSVWRTYMHFFYNLLPKFERRSKSQKAA